MKNRERKTKQQLSPWTFRPDADVAEMVETALNATGIDRSELVNRALRACGPTIVSEFFREMREREQAWNSAAEGQQGAKEAPISSGESLNRLHKLAAMEMQAEALADQRSREAAATSAKTARPLTGTTLRAAGDPPLKGAQR